ncbi:MAG: hypothetical protein FWD14_02310 [Treponema sp.]|nr:hypothetical protein [Treponema sp.]
MKYGLRTAFFLFLFLFIMPVFLFAQQNDFYGSWFTAITEDDEIINVTLIISASELNITLELYEDEKLLDSEVINSAITRWLLLINNDDKTRTNYPTGFTINTISDGFELPLSIFISADKRQLLIRELNESTGYMLEFKRQ